MYTGIKAAIIKFSKHGYRRIFQMETREICSNTYVIKKNKIIKKDYTIFLVFPNRKFIRKNLLRRLLDGTNIDISESDN
jgi:hypothetical protein